MSMYMASICFCLLCSVSFNFYTLHKTLIRVDEKLILIINELKKQNEGMDIY